MADDKKLTLAELDALEAETPKEGEGESQETDETSKSEEGTEEAKQDDSEKEEEKNSENTDESKDKEETSDEDESEETDETEEETEGSIWEDVEALTGEKLEVDFGKSDPDTPEGVSKYIKAVKENTKNAVLEQLKKDAPLAYKAIELELEGKNVKEYFVGDDNDSTDYSSLEIKEDDKKVQKQVIRKALEIKGIDSEDIDTFIDSYEDRDQLYKKSQEAQEGIKKYEDKRRSEYEASIAEEREAEELAINTMVSDVKSRVEDGKIGNFVIPEKDKAKFSEYVTQNMAYQDGKFFVYKEVGEKDLEKIIQEQFFSFKGGNLDSLIEARAKTENVKRLKGASKKGKRLQGSNKKPEKKITLSDL